MGNAVQGGAAEAPRLKCFVVMGFDEKTDFVTGRKLNMNATYTELIKPAVEACGLECIRADEINHSGTIDLPMYQQLLSADLVIADISTGNANALYELGVRHALKPLSTIVIAEDGFKYPFDLNHQLIRSYKHLGVDIGSAEVRRFSRVLREAIEGFKERARQKAEGVRVDPDSPVYTFLNELEPPALRQAAQAAAMAIGAAATAANLAGAAVAKVLQAAEPQAATADPAVATYIADGEAAIAAGDFDAAKTLFGLALKRKRKDCESTEKGKLRYTDDPYLIHRLTLATYKAKEPDEVTALRDALKVLSKLNLEEINDPETMGLAGAIEKRLHENTGDAGHLDRAIDFYERGYYLKDDYYNGINLAFLMDLRAATADGAAERVADHVNAGRIRRDLLATCEAAIPRIKEKQAAPGKAADKDAARQALTNELYWILATQAEAYFGLGELERHKASGGPADASAPPTDWAARYQAAKDEASRLPCPAWMFETTARQIQKLEGLLKTNAELFRKLTA